MNGVGLGDRCRNCGYVTLAVKRVVGVWRDAKRILMLPIGQLLCPRCFAEQGIPEQVDLEVPQDPKKGA